jgi:hypothetical protein
LPRLGTQLSEKLRARAQEFSALAAEARESVGTSPRTPPTARPLELSLDGPFVVFGRVRL